MKYTLLASIAALALATAAHAEAKEKFVIERNIPGAGELTAEELRDISRQSRSVLEELGPDIRWIHSYVAEDKVYCVYEASDKELIRKHAEMGGFPADRITPLATMIDPSTAE
jgi:hypothetical protein